MSILTVQDEKFSLNDVLPNLEDIDDKEIYINCVRTHCRQRSKMAHDRIRNNIRDNKYWNLSTSWMIPADHPAKLLWDMSTLIVNIMGIYLSHTNICDKSFGST